MQIKSLIKYLPLFYVVSLILLSAGHLIFALRTNNYFSNDDFYVLAHFKNHGLGLNVFNFFLNGDMFGFRKVLGYLVFGILLGTFGVNANAFIFTNFFIHTANLVLLFLILRVLTKKDFTAFFLAVIYNKFYLFYFSNIHEYLGAFFCLASIYLFLKLPKKLYLSLTMYILALLSKELTCCLPFLLLAISYVNKTDKRKVIPFFIVMAGYFIYQGYFLLNTKAVSLSPSYRLLFSAQSLISGLVFYFGYGLLTLFAALPLLTRKYKPILILGVSLLTLLPVLFFVNRRETYYLYLPVSYALIYLSYYLPKLNLKTTLIYFLVLFLFGGRSVFPKIAWRIFPNIQRDSIMEVVGIVEKSLSTNPKTATINLRRVNIERDTWLMLNNNDIDLFVNKDISSKYSFSYIEKQRSVYATRNSS